MTGTRRTKSVPETAEILGLSYQGVLGLIRTERLRAIWMGNKYLVPDVAIAEFLGEPAPADDLHHAS
jgi:excisionase family DNA binding protein